MKKMNMERLLTSEGSVTILAIIVSLLGLMGLAERSNPVLHLFWVIRLIAVLIIIYEGTLFKSNAYGIISCMLSLIIGIGAWFKIMHLAHADTLLMIGFLSMLIFYSARFILKRQKLLFDVLKWAWVFTLCIAAPFKIFHWPFAGSLALVAGLLMIALFLCYLFVILTEEEQAE